jgi:8-oxo-dGTP pyrophosphatase MutT (NUDIX family)
MIDERLNQLTDCLYRFGARAIIIRAGKILLVRENNGRYCLPGGGIDHGEEIAAGLCRELNEEIGLKVPEKNVAKVPRGILSQVIDNFPCMLMYFDVRVAANTQPKKVELDYIWVDKESFDKVDYVGEPEEIRFVKKQVLEALCES